MEALSVSEDVLPLSLKQYCLIHIVTNISQFPVSFLLLLPISLRRTLLAYLPGIAIHRLEGTAFLEGIDTSVYWDQLYSQYRQALPVPMDEYEFVKRPFSNPGSIAPMPVNSKEKILDSAVREMVGNYGPIRCACAFSYSISLAILFGLRNIVFKNNAEDVECYALNSSPSMEVLLGDLLIICPHLSIIVPKIYAKNLDKKWQYNIMNTLITAFNKYPKVLNTSLVGQKILDDVRVSEFFSQTGSLCLSGGKDHVIESVKSCVVFNSLKTLLINTELSGDHLHDIFVPYFSQHKPSRSRMQNVCNNLEQLSAGKFLKQEKHPKQHKNSIMDISLIISFQKNLRNVRLYGYFGCSPATDTLMSSLCKLVKQPQLESLMIEGYNRNCQVSIEQFSKIVMRFLLSETQHYQNLAFTNFELFDTPVTSLKMAKLSHSMPKNIPSCCSKSLNITGIRLSTAIVQMLSRIPSCSFDALELSLDGTTEYYIELQNVFNSIKYVLSLNLDDYSLIDNESVAKQVAHFISKPNIQSLALNFIVLTSPTICETISQTFSSVACSNRSLNVIHFNRCFFGIDMDSLEAVFCGLIHLAQKVDLELKFEEDLSMKFMNREHIDVLNKAWVSFTSACPGPAKRIHKLECHLFNAGEDELLKMADVVENLCPVFKNFDEKK